MVTFGGAYSVLAYVAQEAVITWDWLQPGEMLDGLALAETTPGPLIQVVQFVGFLATYRDPGPLNPLTAGFLGSLLTCWVTFVPSFLWVFVGAPWIESARRNQRWQGALRGISAAVVGVVGNLALWSAWHTVVSWIDAVVLVAALLATFRFHVGMFTMLGGAALFGVARWLVGV
jgi:chromate transporter